MHPSSPSLSRSSLLSVMVSARATVGQLYDLGCAFAARLEIDQLIPFVVANCREVLEAEGASVLLLDQSTTSFTFPISPKRTSKSRSGSPVFAFQPILELRRPRSRRARRCASKTLRPIRAFITGLTS